MSYGPTPYDKKSYKESKRRRKQAMRAEQTGRILPFSAVKRRVIVLVCSAALILLAGLVLYFVYFNNSVSGSENTNTSGGTEFNQSDELLQVVNTGSPLEADYVPELESFKNFKVNTLACDDLESFVTNAQSDGVELRVVSAYISYDDQQSLYEEKLESYLSNPEYTEVRAAAAAQKSVPKAGCSEAQTGLLIGFDVTNPSVEAYLQRNCINYGFIQRYTAEKADVTKLNENKSLFRYVGEENAKKMRALNMCLEEYSDYILLQKNQ